MNEYKILTKNARIVNPKNIPNVITAAIRIYSGYYQMQIDATKYDSNTVKITNTI
jgi:hypothetical protein